MASPVTVQNLWLWQLSHSLKIWVLPVNSWTWLTAPATSEERRLTFTATMEKARTMRRADFLSEWAPLEGACWHSRENGAMEIWIVE